MDASRRQFLAAAGLAAANAAAVAEEKKPDALAAIKAVLTRPAPAIWVFTGDSITHGALHTLGWRSYPEHFAERVRWEMRRMRDVVINTGISGDRTGALLADLDWRVLQFKPTVVSIMEGMNDCGAGTSGRAEYGKNLTILVEKIRAAGALPLLNTPNTVYRKNAGRRDDLPAYVEIVKKVAADTRTALVDHWAYWLKTKPDQEKLLPWLEDRAIHPGVYGHRAFAHLIFKELGVFDPHSATCQLALP